MRIYASPNPKYTVYTNHRLRCIIYTPDFRKKQAILSSPNALTIHN